MKITNSFFKKMTRWIWVSRCVETFLSHSNANKSSSKKIAGKGRESLKITDEDCGTGLNNCDSLT